LTACIFKFVEYICVNRQVFRVSVQKKKNHIVQIIPLAFEDGICVNRDEPSLQIMKHIYKCPVVPKHVFFICSKWVVHGSGQHLKNDFEMRFQVCNRSELDPALAV